MAFGCDRLYISPIQSVKCKRCESVHTNYEVNNLKEALALESRMLEQKGQRED